jgi:hypothetical protein
MEGGWHAVCEGRESGNPVVKDNYGRLAPTNSGATAKSRMLPVEQGKAER